MATEEEGNPDTNDEKTEENYEWSAHYDDEGRLYYYNSVTEESAWDPPEDGKFRPPEEETAAESDSKSTSWVAYKDDEGKEYYYNTETGETQWDKPDHYVEAPPVDAEEHAERRDTTEAADSMDVDESPRREEGDDSVEMDVTRDSEVARDADESATEARVNEEVVVDPAVVRLQEAEVILNQTDSILEPKCVSSVAEVVTSEGGNPQKALAALTDNYQGQTAVCGLLSRWLADVRSSDSPDENTSARSQATADQIRDTTQAVIYRFAKEKFSKDTGDRILDLSKTEAAFLEDMMDSPRWRKLLIDLSASHKDSAVLIYCLRAISKLGYHREIAKLVNQSDHFAVFNAMLQSELTIIGKLAVSAGCDPVSAIGLDELVNDLRRACSSTSYTYLYSTEVLRVLMAKAGSLAESSNSPRFNRAIRKWQALAQDLESAMIDPATGTGSSTLFRKRRLDVALTASELHQRQRRRLRNKSGHHQGIKVNGDGESKRKLESSLLKLLKRYSVGMQLDDQAVDPLLPSGVDLNAAEDVGQLLIAHPLCVRALLDHLFKPGATRVTSPVLRNKCSRLIAIAVIAAEKAAKIESGYRDVSVTSISDEVSLTRNIVQGSQLCEALESVISFSIDVDNEKVGPTALPGEKLCSLGQQYAPIALGACIWAKTFCQGHEFATSASFATLSTSILSLVRVVAVKHPFARRDALEVGVTLAFQGHSNSDISVQKINSIKEQSLRLMLTLLVHGEIALVLEAVVNRLQSSGAAEMDDSLLRYFIGGVVECVRPPVSNVFIQSFGRLLTNPKCVDAVRSSYFATPHKLALKKLLRHCHQVAMASDVGAKKDMVAFVSSIQQVYGFEG